jgi:hypothetical protein
MTAGQLVHALQHLGGFSVHLDVFIGLAALALLGIGRVRPGFEECGDPFSVDLLVNVIFHAYEIS